MCVWDGNPNTDDAQDANDDWYRLYGVASGKVRLSVKFKPVRLGSSDGRGGLAKDPLAFCQLTLMEGKNLLNVEAFKKSDPFCTVKLGASDIGKTGVVENSLDPKWDSQFSFAYSNTNLGIHLDLFDYNPIAANKSLGSTSVFLEDVFSLKSLHEILYAKLDPDAKPEKDRPDSFYPVLDQSRQNQLDQCKKDGLQIAFDQETLSADIWVYLPNRACLIRLGPGVSKV